MSDSVIDYKDRQRAEAQAAAQTVLKAVNQIGFDEKAFAEAICSDHRTLQQIAMRAFCACIKRWSAEEYSDARNQRTVEISKRIVATFDAELYFPLI